VFFFILVQTVPLLVYLADKTLNKDEEGLVRCNECSISAALIGVQEYASWHEIDEARLGVIKKKKKDREGSRAEGNWVHILKTLPVGLTYLPFDYLHTLKVFILLRLVFASETLASASVPYAFTYEQVAKATPISFYCRVRAFLW